MDITVGVKVEANEEGWNHVYGGGWAPTPENVRQAVEDGLYAGESPFDFVTVDADGIGVRVNLEGWAFLMGDEEPSEEAVIRFVKEAITADGTIKLA
ncbi:hypothetical protein HOU95_gp055 [Streptomyces phage Hiyaa]|uniref:Uncharacterized protein n=1 Tax=Streptomyces phage Hiyaa TaxID=2499072 RepID=A0A3S9U8V3_9CAUD|nr:hypothetical protein HOU95_gp055 [Streptomyces phage Hiyaa]AZS06752.1 hypothetical protein SEA_HIYAA_113 [Streptomyces phage Hiyaa]